MIIDLSKIYMVAKLEAVLEARSRCIYANIIFKFVVVMTFPLEGSTLVVDFSVFLDLYKQFFLILNILLANFILQEQT